MAGEQKYDFLRGNGCGTWYGALRFLLANRNITAALIGLSMPDQIEKNLKALDNTAQLDEAYRAELIAGIDMIELDKKGFCTGCRYCEVCSKKFSPSKLMQILRDFKLYGMKEQDLKNWIYSGYVHDQPPEVQLVKCVECGKCQAKCPQKLEIVAEIKRVKKIFK